ncbi:MAG: RNA polymerase sigma factor [Muribaculaceae bacterium]|nr:RNA polymerase sigma factor [Muribaculaceae bacterium]
MKQDKLTYSFLSLRDKLHRSALRFLKNDEDAKDALQDTFFKLWKNEPVRSDAEARNKLFTVLKNVCIDRLRRPPAIDVDKSGIEEMTVQPDFSEDMEQLETLLSTGLSPIQRKIYIFVVHDGLEYEDIALKLDMSVEAVRMNMSRARKRIKENYQKLNR